MISFTSLGRWKPVCIGLLWVIPALIFILQLALQQTDQRSCSLSGSILGQLPNFIFWAFTSGWVAAERAKAPSEIRTRHVLMIIGGMFLIHLIYNYVSYALSCPSLTWSIAWADYQSRYSFGWVFFQLIIYLLIVFAFYYLPVGERQATEESQVQVPETSYITGITIKEKGVTFSLQLEKVQWIIAHDYYIKLYDGKSEYLVRDSMNNFEKQLDPSLFLRIHRSTILNLNFVHTVKFSDEEKSWMACTTGGEQFRVSRNRKEEIRQRLAGER